MTVRLVVELAVQKVSARGWDFAQWDTDTWSVAADWTDVTCDVEGVSIAGGRNGPTDRFRSAASIVRLDNRSGVYNSWSDASPFAPPGTRHLGAGSGVRVSLDVNGTRYPLHTGVASTWHHRRDDPNRWVDIGADDTLARLTMADLPEQASQGAGEHAGARLQRILAAHGMESVPHAFDVGVVPLQATTLADDAWSLACLTADSDGGWLWCDGAGVIRFYQGDRDATDPRWTHAQATFADNDRDGDVCWSTVELDDDADAVFNHADIAAAGGAAHYADDPTSQYRYGVRSFPQRHDLIHTDETWSQTLATKIVARTATGGTRPAMVRVTTLDDAEVDRLAGLLWHDRVRVVVHDVADTLAAESFIDTYQWGITPLGVDRECLVSLDLTLSPAVAFIVGARWDTAATWDGATTVWGY
jgi:hypothetical protein